MERPSCPKGHAGRVTRDGWLQRKDRPELGKRQRWECFPADPGIRSHKFLEPLPRLVRVDQPAHCSVCATKLEAWEGQPAPRRYGFTARDIAGALVAVARGLSYRRAAEHVRFAAGRPLDTAVRTRSVKGKKNPVSIPSANQHPQLVSDWVSTYAAALFGFYVARQVGLGLSGTVVLDAGGSGKGGRKRPGRASNSFQILAVVAYDNNGRPFVAAVKAAARNTNKEWAQLLSSVPFAPTRVVADRDGAGAKAAAQVWPKAVRYSCEWHIGKNLLDHLPSDASNSDEIRAAARIAASSRADWDNLGRKLRSLHKKNRAWWNMLDTHRKLTPVVHGQVGRRDRSGPTTTGSVEHFLDTVKDKLADRVAPMTNADRATALLQLLAADWNRWADEQAWADLLRDWLNGREGAAPAQRQHVDKEGSPSLRSTTRGRRPQTQGQKGKKKTRLPRSTAPARWSYAAPPPAAAISISVDPEPL